MGLTIKIKGYEGAYDCGYITYCNFILELVKNAYGRRAYDIFKESLVSRKSLSDDEVKYWNNVCDDDLDLLIWHSDLDGKFTYQECRKIAKALDKVPNFEMQGHNYGDMKPYNMLDKFRDMFWYCAKHRVNMYYT